MSLTDILEGVNSKSCFDDKVDFRSTELQLTIKTLGQHNWQGNIKVALGDIIYGLLLNVDRLAFTNIWIIIAYTIKYYKQIISHETEVNKCGQLLQVTSTSEFIFYLNLFDDL